MYLSTIVHLHVHVVNHLQVLGPMQSPLTQAGEQISALVLWADLVSRWHHNKNPKR